MNYINEGKRDILIFPNFKGIEKIQTIRNKYDELANIIPPHITLAFPFKLPISNEELKEQLEQILRRHEKIDITCEGISFIKDETINKYYIFLNINEGNKTIKNIHKDIYEKVLKIPKPSNYIPHITLGTVNEIDANITLNETFETTIENIIVESIGKNEESIIEFKIELGKEQNNEINKFFSN